VGGSQPAYVENVQGNKAVLRGDGVDDMFFQPNALSGASAFTMIAVASFGAALQSGQKGFLGGRTDGGNTDLTSIHPLSAAYRCFVDNTSLDFNDNETKYATDEVKIAIFQQDAGVADAAKFFSNGRQDSTTFTEGNGANSLATWGVFNIVTGGGPTAGFFADSDVCMKAYIPRLLSTTERQSVERFLANKWGLALQ